MSDEDRLRADVILRLMCDLSLDYAAMSQKWGIDFKQHFADSIAQLAEPEADGLIVLSLRAVR